LEKRLDDLDEKSKNEESRYYFYTESSWVQKPSLDFFQ
jgi:hypothetical protein